MEYTVVKEVITSSAKISIRSDGIVHVLFHDNITIDKENQDENYKVFQEITKGKKFPFLFEAGDGVTVTREGRDYSIKMELTTPAICYGILAQNLAYKLIADFYYRFNKPKLPYKVFRKRSEAEEWLKGFVKDLP